MKQLVSVEHIHVNVSQSVIITTEDKMRLCIDKYMKRAERKQSWMAPAGILLAILTTFATTSFRSWLLTAETWQALFIILGAVSFLWLLLAMKYAFASLSTEDLINELRPASAQRTGDQTETK